MIILTIRTDNPEAELGLYDDNTKLGYEIWSAHRELSETIFSKIEGILKAQSKSWDDIEGIVCFKGPGSFTGLRIGLTVGNALAASQSIPIVSEGNETWLETGIARIQQGDNEKIAVPDYGREARITTPRK